MSFYSDGVKQRTCDITPMKMGKLPGIYFLNVFIIENILINSIPTKKFDTAIATQSQSRELESLRDGVRHDTVAPAAASRAKKKWLPQSSW